MYPIVVDQTDEGVELCYFLAGPSIEGLTILGDSFLRSAYVVYDIANNQVAIASAAPNATATSNITPIPTGTSIPGASSTASMILGLSSISLTNAASPITSYQGVGSGTMSFSALSTAMSSEISSASASSKTGTSAKTATASGSTASSTGTNAASTYGISTLGSMISLLVALAVNAVF